MRRRLLPLALLLCASAAAAGTTRIPLDPDTLGGAAVFTAVEGHVAAAAQAAGLAFAPDPRPLPPQVLLTFDMAGGQIQKRNGLLYWRGDMLPDQLAPGETGTFVRRHRRPDGTWRTVRAQAGAGPASRLELLPVDRANAHFILPAMILETPYRIGTVGEAAATLVLWRRADEDSPPLGGFLALTDEAPPALLDALNARLAPFAAQADWAAEFDAFSR